MRGSSVTLTGQIAWGYAWDRAIRSGFSRSLLVGFVAIFILLFLLFKSPTTPFVVLFPVLVAVLASFGLMHFIQIPLNFLTAMFGAVTLGLGVDYAIHLVHRYHEESARGGQGREQGREQGQGGNNERALNIACMKIGRNTLVTSLTTMAAFSSMALSPIRMLGEYGIMSFIAISFSALSVFLFVPSLLVLEEKIGWGARGGRGVGGGVGGGAGGGRRTLDFSGLARLLGTERLISRTMERVADFSLKRSVGAVLIIGLTLLPILAGVGMIESRSEQEMWIPEGDPLMVAWRVVDEEFCDYEYSTILVRADDIRTPEMMKALAEVEASVREVPGVVAVTGINCLLEGEGGGEIRAEKREIERRIAAIPADLRESFVTNDYTAALIIIKADEEIEEKQVREIDDAILFVETPGDASFRHASFSTLFSQMDRMMEESQAKTTGVSLVLVFAILFSFFRTPFRIILAFAPVLFAIIYALGTMGLVGIPFTPLTVMIMTILIGLGTDYSVHFVSRYREERAKGFETQAALQTTTLTVGSAILTASLTTLFGFLALTTMSLVPVQEFGRIAAVGLVYAAFLTPVVVSLGILAQERVAQALKRRF